MKHTTSETKSTKDLYVYVSKACSHLHTRF